MKTCKDFFRNDGVFDAKAFLNYQQQLFDAFRDQVSFLREAQMPGGEAVWNEFLLLDGELKNQIRGEFRPDTLSSAFRRFRTAADGWSAQNLGDMTDDLTGAETMVGGETCKFSAFLFENDFSEALLRKAAANASREHLHPNMVSDRQFSGGTPRNNMRTMQPDAPIFPGGGPRPEDIRQTEDGSCFMLGTLLSLAQKRPQVIRDLITDNGDGTVTVHFFEAGDNGKLPHDVTVEKSLPGTDQASAPWVRLIEKAFMASRLKTNPVSHQPEPVSMDALGWYDPSVFMEHILPRKVQSEAPEAELMAQPDFEASKQKFAEMLLAAQNTGAVITITSEKHVMSFQGISGQSGNYTISYYDQYSNSHNRISLDRLFSPDSPLDMVNVTAFDRNGNPSYQAFTPKATAKKLKEQNAPLTEAQFISEMRKRYLGILNKDIKDAQLNDTQAETDIIAAFGKVDGVNPLLRREFASLQSRNLSYRAFMDQLSGSPGKQYLDSVLNKMEEAFIVGASAKEPESAQAFRMVREILGLPIHGDPEAIQNPQNPQNQPEPQNLQNQPEPVDAEPDPFDDNYELFGQVMSSEQAQPKPVTGQQTQPDNNFSLFSEPEEPDNNFNLFSEPEEPDNDLSMLSEQAEPLAESVESDVVHTAPEREQPEPRPEQVQQPEADPHRDAVYEEIANHLRTLEDSRKKRSDNSPEFIAMADAIRDLSYAKKNGVAEEKLQLLEERAFAKCSYYESRKNPITGDGKLRKSVASAVKGKLRELHPTVEQNMAQAPSEGLISMEVASLLADRMVEKHPDVFRKSPDQPEIDENLRAQLVRQWEHNPEIRKFARNIKTGTEKEFLEKMCKKDMRELFTKTVIKQLIEPVSGGNEKLSAKEKKSAEASFGIQIGGPSR